MDGSGGALALVELAYCAGSSSLTARELSAGKERVLEGSEQPSPEESGRLEVLPKTTHFL